MRSLTIVLRAALLAGWALADPTWPSLAIDELEDIMYLISGTNNRGFAVPVTPCSSPGFGRIAAAEWLRTAFHDMASCNIFDGTGGLDASLMYETTYAENIGASFPNTFTTLAPYYTTRSSVSDLLAVATYVGTRACGGPVVRVRAGRVDATGPGPVGFVPQPQNPLGTFQGQFGRMGFNNTDMITMTACGHSLGGAHAANFPQIVIPGTVLDDYAFLDTTPAQLDNKIATEYISGTTADPLVVGPAVKNGQASDAVVFGSDLNATMQTLTDATSFTSICADILSRMIEAVPASTVFTDPIVPYEVKPSGIQLSLISGGTLITFAGSIRVRTTVRGVSGVTLTYKTRTGAAGGTITATNAGTANGFDDSFLFYSFSSNIPASSGISSFTVTLSLAAGGTELHDNNGTGYPVQDNIMFLSPNSCINPNPDTNGNQKMTVLAAVRSAVDTGSASLQLSLPVTRSGAVGVPILQPLTVAMTIKYTGLGPYNVYTSTYNIAFGQVPTTHFDVSGGGSADTFKQVSQLGTQCNAIDLNPPSTTSTTMSSTSSLTTSTSSSSSPTASGWSFLGCYTDNVNARTLANNIGIPAGPAGMTPEQCLAAGKAAGYLYCGVEYGQECWCDNTLNNGGALAPDGNAGCNMPCNGNQQEVCGGSNRLDLYYFGTVSSTTSVSSTSTSSTTSSTSTTSTSTSITSSSSPTATPGWNALGCYTDDVNARTLSVGMPVPGGAGAMTIELCEAACQAAGYPLSGVEWSQECYCDNKFENGGAPAPDGNAGCNMPCNGNAAEICGGSNRLNVFSYVPGGTSTSTSTTSTSSSSSSSSSTTSSSSAPTASGWTYLGCYTDSVDARSLPNVGVIPGGPTAMTNPLCQAACQSEGYSYSGTEYPDECYCGNALENGGSPAPDGEALCDMTCDGDTTQICGGPNRLSLFSFGAVKPPPSSSSSSTTLTTSTTQTSSSTSSSSSPSSTGVAGWSLLGCYTDDVTARTLGYSGIVAGSPQSMTVELCQAACTSQGYKLAGVEYSGECYCDNSLQNGGAPAPDGNAGCDMPCYGNPAETCGGPNRLDLYSYGSSTAADPPPGTTTTSSSSSSSSASSSTSSSTTSTTTSSSTTSTSSYGPTIGPYTPIGCYTDNPASRTFNLATADTDSMTLELCASYCRGDLYFGVEYSSQCYCGSSLSTATSPQLPQASCYMPCEGDSTQTEICGGPNALNVYKLTNPAAVSPPSQPSPTASPTIKQTVGGYTYYGCMTELATGRALAQAEASADEMTLELCEGLCSGFKYFGTEYARECYCGSSVDAGSSIVADGQCNMVCVGDGTEFCGGSDRLSVYVAGS